MKIALDNVPWLYNTENTTKFLRQYLSVWCCKFNDRLLDLNIWVGLSMSAKRELFFSVTTLIFLGQLFRFAHYKLDEILYSIGAELFRNVDILNLKFICSVKLYSLVEIQLMAIILPYLVVTFIGSSWRLEIRTNGLSGWILYTYQLWDSLLKFNLKSNPKARRVFYCKEYFAVLSTYEQYGSIIMLAPSSTKLITVMEYK